MRLKIFTTPGQSGSESNGNKEVIYSPQTRNQMQFNVIPRTKFGIKNIRQKSCNCEWIISIWEEYLISYNCVQSIINKNVQC